MNILESDVTYGQSRGYEQAYIEAYDTKKGIIGEPISETNRGNKINSFDHNNMSREETRQEYFEDAYEEKMYELRRRGICNKD